MVNSSLMIWTIATAVLPAAGSGLKVDPLELRLEGPSARRLILVERANVEGDPVDLTRAARYRSLNPAIATVDNFGVVRAVGDGETSILVESNHDSRAIPVRVDGSKG